ncbi:MAG TPA: carbon starvation protein A, partial [Phycisphaerae bacterium]|nr:carbon starvation protein A [Phycisphaerae bacterium]
MSTLLIAVLSFVGFIVAYHTYGRWLSKKIFSLDDSNPVPSEFLRDDVDFCPTKKSILFGHHFTSIAGTGPIVGPAIAVFWGWLPAVIWVVFGSIFIGAVHDFGALVISMRNKGQTVGEVAGKVMGPRARILLLLILVLELTIVLAIFGLVIAVVFAIYPESVLSVWVSLPIAVLIGFWVYKKKGGIVLPSIAALGILYLMIWIGAEYLPINLANIDGVAAKATVENHFTYSNAVVIWTVILFIYCFFASVLPVWVLLQPRDYINSNQLFVAMAMVIIGIAIASFTGNANLFDSPPAITSAKDSPTGSPPILPFLFITIACGAVSGFHSLVSSGTSSKQLARETDAKMVGYGSMLSEGALAIIVILACCAGVGMGLLNKDSKGQWGYDPGIPTTEKIDTAKVGTETDTTNVDPTKETKEIANSDKPVITGQEAWRTKYKTGSTWKSMGLKQKLAAFIEGGANFLKSAGIPLGIGIGVLSVMVACFAATTLDTATRLQRYVLQELGRTIHVKPLSNKFVATAVAVITGCGLAVFAGKAPGAGGLMLWPLFGATNQLLAGLGFLLIMLYLVRRNKPIWFLVIPAVIMLVLPAWAMLWQMFNPASGWFFNLGEKWLVFGIGAVTQILMVWIILEAILAYGNAKKQG